MSLYRWRIGPKIYLVMAVLALVATGTGAIGVASLYQPQYSALNTWAVAGALIVSVLAVLFVHRNISRPLSLIASAMTKLASGDVTGEVPPRPWRRNREHVEGRAKLPKAGRRCR